MIHVKINMDISEVSEYLEKVNTLVTSIKNNVENLNTLLGESSPVEIYVNCDLFEENLKHQLTRLFQKEIKGAAKLFI